MDIDEKKPLPLTTILDEMEDLNRRLSTPSVEGDITSKELEQVERGAQLIFAMLHRSEELRADGSIFQRLIEGYSEFCFYLIAYRSAIEGFGQLEQFGKMENV